MNSLVVIVNTSDGFEDCWGPFFNLFQKYWPDCPWPLVLNTENKMYRHTGLDIRCTQVALGQGRRLTWSECLMRCLDGIDSEAVLYLQEDFFLEACVNTDAMQSFANSIEQGQADVVRLMECGGSGPWHATDNPALWRVDAQAKYRIALQAALWRTSTLRAQLRAHESPWQLEVFGSGRSRRSGKDKVFCVNRDRFHGPGKEVFPYTPTGVVKGQWESFVPALFEREGIVVDFAQRGFYNREASVTKKAPLARRLSDRIRSLV
jgi:hypothetical protein